MPASACVERRKRATQVRVFSSLRKRPCKRFPGILPAIRSDTGGQIEATNPPPRKQFGRLEFLSSAAALCLTIGSFVGLWPFNLPIALVLLAVLYGVLRDLRSLNRLKHPVTAQQMSRRAREEQTDRASR